jgi:hypothetical protein
MGRALVGGVGAGERPHAAAIVLLIHPPAGLLENAKSIHLYVILKGLSHETDFKNVDNNLQYLA